MLLSGRTALGLLFLGIGALLLRETYAVDVGAFAVPGEMGTMTYPRILLFGWIGLSILYLLNPGKPFNAHDLRASLTLRANGSLRAPVSRVADHTNNLPSLNLNTNRAGVMASTTYRRNNDSRLLHLDPFSPTESDKFIVQI